MDTGDIPSIKALVVVDGDGKRIVSRYYKTDLATLADEHAFEKKLFDKTIRTNAKNEGALAPALPRPLGSSDGADPARRLPRS